MQPYYISAIVVFFTSRLFNAAAVLCASRLISEVVVVLRASRLISEAAVVMRASRLAPSVPSRVVLEYLQCTHSWMVRSV